MCSLPCKEAHTMATNPALDPELLNRALAVGGQKTKKATVTAALEEYIARRDQAKIAQSFHKFDDWDPAYDYKEERRRRDQKLGLAD